MCILAAGAAVASVLPTLLALALGWFGEVTSADVTVTCESSGGGTDDQRGDFLVHGVRSGAVQ